MSDQSHSFAFGADAAVPRVAPQQRHYPHVPACAGTGGRRGAVLRCAVALRAGGQQHVNYACVAEVCRQDERRCAAFGGRSVGIGAVLQQQCDDGLVAFLRRPKKRRAAERWVYKACAGAAR